MSEVNTISPIKPSSNGEPAPDDRADSRLQLKNIVERIHTATVEGARNLDQSFETDLLAPMLETFSKAEAIHAELADELSRTPETDALWNAVLRYRQATLQRVLTPLNARISAQIAEKVNRRFIKLFSDLQENVARTPGRLVIPEPPNLYERDESDELWMRLRKTRVRTSRRFRAIWRNALNGMRRLIGRQRIDSPTPILNVNLKKLLDYHLQVRISESLISKFDVIHDFLAEGIAAYEKAETGWSYDLLEIEQILAIPVYEVKEFLPWLTEEDSRPQAPAGEIRERLQKVAASLQAGISQFAQKPSPSLEIVEHLLRAHADALYHDCNCYGTFMLDDRTLPEFNARPAAMLEESTAFRSAWYGEANNRINMNARLHDLRDFLIRRQESLLDSIAKASIIPILNSFSRLHVTFNRTSEEADKFFNTVPSTDSNELLLRNLKPLHQAITNQFKEILNDVSNLLQAGQALEEPGTMFWNDLQRFIDGLPEQIEVHETLPTPVAKRDAAKHRYVIHLREIVQSALLGPLAGPLARPAKTLQKAVINTWEETQQVEYMVDYNLKAAFSELEDDSDEENSETRPVHREQVDDALQSPVDAARELMISGLARSTEKLGELALDLQEPWKALVGQAFITILAYSNDILHNVRKEDDMNDRWTNLKMRVNRSMKRLGRSTDEAFDRFSQIAGRAVRLGRRRTRQLIKKGQTAVGVVDQNEDQWLSIVELASNIDSILNRLPLVYRRLFSLKPLYDLDLLEGRNNDIDFVKKHYTQWQNSQTGPLLLAMPDGSGRTSLMNVLMDSVFGDAEVKSLKLAGRITDIQVFASLVADALSVETKTPLTIDELEVRIISMKRADVKRIIVIDRFEHMLLCTPGGQDIIERVLIFMSRTDNLIYWVINISIHAWHFLEKTMNPSSGFISSYRTASLQRQALEDIILKRHHRSGMNLHFRSNVSSKSFFDFARPSSEKTLQEAHRSAFFDKLYRLSGENILLALLYWLRSVEFDSEQDTLFVNAIEPINFAFLDALDLPRAFTIKSFLMHGTLTLEEHMRVFKLNKTESTFILESLLNLHVIEPILQDPEEKIHFRIETDQPYRLHPLIVHPVLELLKRKHIVY